MIMETMRRSFWDFCVRNPGGNSVVIYLKDVNAMKRLPGGFHLQIRDSGIRIAEVKNMAAPMLKLCKEY